MNIIADLIKLGNAEKKKQESIKALDQQGVTICSGYLTATIQIYNGIDQIAEMIGVDLKEEPYSDYKRKSFTLDGVFYFQLTSSIDGSYLPISEVKA